MKEHVLLMAIASVGFSGLLSIYNDLKVQQREYSLLHSISQYDLSNDQANQISNALQPFEIQAKDYQLGITINIVDFSESDLFSIDFGNGNHSILERASCQYYYAQPGEYEIKLFRNNLLIHARKLEIEEQHVNDDLAIHL